MHCTVSLASEKLPIEKIRSENSCTAMLLLYTHPCAPNRDRVMHIANCNDRRAITYEPSRDFWCLDKNSRRRIWSRCRFPGF